MVSKRNWLAWLILVLLSALLTWALLPLLGHAQAAPAEAAEQGTPDPPLLAGVVVAAVGLPIVLGASLAAVMVLKTSSE